MKKLIPISFLGLTLAFLLSTSLIAQDKTEVSVQIKKEGKVIMDTTYQYKDDAEAKHAVKMMEILSGDNNHSKEMVFISDDGKTKEIIKEHGDGENVEVIVIKKKVGEDCGHEDGEEIEVIVEKKIKKKPTEH